MLYAASDGSSAEYVTLAKGALGCIAKPVAKHQLCLPNPDPLRQHGMQSEFVETLRLLLAPSRTWPYVIAGPQATAAPSLTYPDFPIGLSITLKNQFITPIKPFHYPHETRCCIYITLKLLAKMNENSLAGQTALSPARPHGLVISLGNSCEHKNSAAPDSFAIPSLLLTTADHKPGPSL